jgi:hypothetical protein
MAGCAGGPFRYALELEPGVRKNVLLFAGLLPLINQMTAESGRSILYLTADGGSEARAKLDMVDMFPFVLDTRMQILTWDDIEPKPENGNRRIDLAPYWVIGDLDTDTPLEPNRYTTAKVAAVRRVCADGACPALLMHQRDKAPLVAFPPTFSNKPAPPAKAAAKGGCFIATAACGSPYAEEVNLLRGFRDEVLAPRALGRALVAAYERCSPPLAGWIEGRPRVRAVVRRLMIGPLARMAKRAK